MLVNGGLMRVRHLDGNVVVESMPVSDCEGRRLRWAGRPPCLIISGYAFEVAVKS